MVSESEVKRFALAFVIASLIASRGRRKKSLSPSGAIAGFLVGFLTFASSVRFGTTLLAFYLSATRATRYKAFIKRKIEDGFTAEAGNRSAPQVLASSLPACLVAVTYLLLFRYDNPVIAAFPLRSYLLLAYLLFFSACAGDTFASEIGIAMPGRGCAPVLILAPWKTVPRGTNGGISWQGTFASAVGGFIVGSAFFLTSPEYSFAQLWLVVIGVLGGILGSAIDSVLGMLLQASWFDTESQKVLKSAPPKSRRPKCRHICGADIMSGEAVNAISAVLTMALAPLFLPLF